VFTVATLTLSVVAGVIAIGFNATLDAATTDPARFGDPWDVVVIPDDIAAAELETVLGATPEVANWYSVAERRVADRAGTITARALDGDLESTGFVIGDGRMLSAPDEAVVGHALLDRLGVDVGDTATVTLLGEPITLKIVGWFATTEDSGEILLLHMDGLRAVQPDAQPSVWLATADSDTAAGELSSVLADATADRATLRIRETFDELDAFRIAFAVITLLILAVGLSNLVASTMQMMQERIRDVAVLKALGFTPVQVVASVAIGAAALATIAALLGALLAMPIYSGLMDALGVEIGVGPGFGVAPGTIEIIVLLIVVVASTTLLAALAARRPARAAVADVLRTE
jgi:putative ABC transport system permease protein